MPTHPPNPISAPLDEEEARLRVLAVEFIRELCYGLKRRSYSTRSHMPCKGMDYTAFAHSLTDLQLWAEARPDWTLEIINKAVSNTMNKKT
jgi:hypothetical protein